MRVIISIGVFILLSLNLYSQGEINDESTALFRNERTFYILLNNNGAGFGYSYGKMINIRFKKQWHFEAVRIKDAKEYKISRSSNYRRFVYGKQNDFFAFRAGYGFLHKQFLKKDMGGIEIRYFYNAGLSLGVKKPMYYYVFADTITIAKFDDNFHSDVIGGASYFKGLDEISFIPGAYAKIGTSFEFSKKDLAINALEAGLIFDVFPQKINIMANNSNNRYFLSLFLSYRFGMVINPRAVASTAEQKLKLSD